MTLATLQQVLEPASQQGYCVAGLVVSGWEEARAYTRAAIAENVPVILQAGPSCRAHTPLPILAAMFRNLAENAPIPVVAHLDHGYTVDECQQAIDCGFTSVMIDGSKLPLRDNIKITQTVVKRAHAAGVSCEGEIGFVGRTAGNESVPTNADEARLFATETNVDAMAVSVGTTHLQQTQKAMIDLSALAAIQSATPHTPLVLHGASGIPYAMRQHLARQTNVCKMNIGTELRMVFGKTLHATIQANPDMFDRTQLLRPVEEPIEQATRHVLQNLKAA